MRIKYDIDFTLGAMEYIDVTWKHSNTYDPVRLVSELGPDRFETRKIEFFPDGRVGFASSECSSLDTRLGEMAVPPLTEINEETQFCGVYLTAEEFENLWCKYANLRT